MSGTKEEIYNLTLSALLLSDEVDEISTSKSNNVNILNRFWDIAFHSTLQDLDLDSTSTPIQLELIEELPSTHLWTYAYKYPSKSVFFRRIESGFLTDNRSTHIPKRVANHEGQRAIFTNEYQAYAECITKDIDIDMLNPMARMAVAYKLAILAAPLVTGKGAKKLKDTLKDDYILAKIEAQETDRLENYNYESDSQRSEFVEERLS